MEDSIGKYLEKLYQRRRDEEEATFCELKNYIKNHLELEKKQLEEKLKEGDKKQNTETAIDIKPVAEAPEGAKTQQVTAKSSLLQTAFNLRALCMTKLSHYNHEFSHNSKIKIDNIIDFTKKFPNIKNFVLFVANHNLEKLALDNNNVQNGRIKELSFNLLFSKLEENQLIEVIERQYFEISYKRIAKMLNNELIANLYKQELTYPESLRKSFDILLWLSSRCSSAKKISQFVEYQKDLDGELKKFSKIRSAKFDKILELTKYPEKVKSFLAANHNNIDSTISFASWQMEAGISIFPTILTEDNKDIYKRLIDLTEYTELSSRLTRESTLKDFFILFTNNPNLVKYEYLSLYFCRLQNQLSFFSPETKFGELQKTVKDLASECNYPNKKLKNAQIIGKGKEEEKVRIAK